ncbi:MAG: 16S rRNA (adenine(1518)-N(6)/adenine(1519)-N(6))-dimethyltransferase RsmA, partial [Gammaproteobacteria bacterium]|nr:16S rRNA (adenine(1518)-N(6)/adenine(1519)-N(6))-dimethyltransferase RsmA [Gammaproteobacteria bacterium]
RPRKRFGQNFLHDAGIISRIVQCIAPSRDQQLVEIGPGQGAITRELLRATGRLQAIELDRDLIEPLAATCAGIGELEIHNADALDFEFCALADAGPKLRVVGNLPYNISTPILFHLLEQAHCIHDMHFMLQKEVVERMGAEPGGKAYGRLSVMLQAQCEVTPLFDIGPGAFNPPPKVDSSFVRLVPFPSPRYRIDDVVRFRQLVAQAFSQRRKTVRNSLRGLLTPDQISAAGVDPGVRAERISVAGFVALANGSQATGQEELEATD